jgi:ElaB/YqjD/DUF883 family membrane-anchored ribosome-binding protein
MNTTGTTSTDVRSPPSRKSTIEPEVATDGPDFEERLRSVYQKGKEKAQHAEESFENYVRAHPIKSVLFASGIGLVVGVLLGRRR